MPFFDLKRPIAAAVKGCLNQTDLLLAVCVMQGYVIATSLLSLVALIKLQAVVCGWWHFFRLLDNSPSGITHTLVCLDVATHPFLSKP